MMLLKSLHQVRGFEFCEIISVAEREIDSGDEVHTLYTLQWRYKMTFSTT